MDIKCNKQVNESDENDQKWVVSVDGDIATFDDFATAIDVVECLAFRDMRVETFHAMRDSHFDNASVAVVAMKRLCDKRTVQAS